MASVRDSCCLCQRGEVRAAIEAKREQTIAAPRHENEAHDAAPDLLRALWGDLNEVAFRLGLVDSAENAPYSPAIYTSVYGHFLSHRRQLTVNIRRLLPNAASVYEGLDGHSNLRATPEEATEILARLEAELPADDAAWYEI